MRLNLGCGSDVRSGYVNVDYFGLDAADYDEGIKKVDLSKFPWPWADDSIDEILLMDVLEHFPYSKTGEVLGEIWRVLKPDAFVDIQVPDFEECAKAMMWWDHELTYNCNKCGFAFDSSFNRNLCVCPNCRQHRDVTGRAAMQRLYGGQDRDGNWHYAAFTKRSLGLALTGNGLDRVEFKELNQNGETYRQNWNIYARAFKNKDLW